MAFLKKHYEKILLALLLTIFIVLLAFLLALWRQNEQIQVEKMKEFKEPPPNYVPQKFENAGSPFRVLETLAEKPIWNAARSREGNPRLFTDFMIPYPMAICPYCVRVIPAKYFPVGDGAGNCPFPDCGKTLHAPYSSSQETELDSDGDGIPDKDEIKLGLNPKDRSDADIDSDDDGFSNYEEFFCKTNIKDAKSRPPYHEKLFVRVIDRAKLPFRLKNVSFTGAREKETAQIQLELEARVRGKLRSQSRFLKLNDTYQSLAGPFKIVDVIPKFTKKANGMEENESQIVVQKKSGDGEKIVLEIGKVIYEPRVKAVLGIGLVTDAKEYEVYPGSSFVIGKLKTGEDRYKVIAIDQSKGTVTVEFERDGKNYVIGKESMLQQKIASMKKASRPRRPRNAGERRNRE